MTTDDPRTVLRDRIVARIDSSLAEQCVGERFDEEAVADAVMELLVDVRPSPWLRAGYVIADIREESTDG